MSTAGGGSGAAASGASGAPPATGGTAQAGGGDGGGAGSGGAGASAGSSGSSAHAGAGSGNAGNGGGTGGGAGTMGGGSGGMPGSLDLVVAPDGVESAAGTLDAPTTLASALTRITAGHTIFARAGSYTSNAQVTIARENSGTSDAPKSLVAYASEHPVLDFSSQPYGTSSNPRGLQINGSYWHVRGVEVMGSADNGIYVAGNGNVIEGCVTHGNRDTGLQIGRASSDDADPSSWPSNNLILNCESYDNYDAPPGGGENADGFAAKLTVGAGNVFRGCVSHHNIDDGWDLYTKTETGPIGPVTIDQCVAYANGTLTDGTSNDNGDRNGFKLGGDDIAVAHVVTRSVAYKNGKNGFTWNSNPGAIRLSNNLAFDNVEGNFKFGDNSTPTAAIFTNNVSLWTTTSSTQSDKAMGTDQSGTNAWWDKSDAVSVTAKGLSVTTADFAVALASPKLTRNADGSLNFAAFALASGSDLVNAGVVPPGELPFTASSYYQGTPDLGAVETK
ncbi:MAG TPA: right-handed parallel beta-helix repeat-containing protein [Polyangiaceae bacterium]|nr:right-handed parallel beta-helix repeat-containing protein [Polyangiaceae bacterium]